jgi:hypothetical protein
MNDLNQTIETLRTAALAYRFRADRDADFGGDPTTIAYNLSQAANFTRAADSIQTAIDIAAARTTDTAEVAA